MMEKSIKPTMTIGEIVTQYPATSNLFKQHRIDFCCGGNRALSEVLTEKGMDIEAFMRELEQEIHQAEERNASDQDWSTAELSRLIDHIVGRHHAYLNQELPLLSQFTTKIFRVHGEHHPELGELHKLFHQLKAELEQHLIKEEEILFPLIKEAERTGDPSQYARAKAAIQQLEAEHSAAGDLLKQMRELTGEYALPEDACRTYTLTFHKLAEMESDLFQHIHLENNILFPRVGQ